MAEPPERDPELDAANDPAIDPAIDAAIDAADEAFVTALLRGPNTAPARMPDEVWLRLERAVLHEAAAREAGTPAAAAPNRRGGARLYALAASAAVIVGGTVLATTAFRDGGTGPGPDAVLAAGTPTERIVASGTQYRPTTLAGQAKATFKAVQAGLGTAGRQAASPAALSVSAAPQDITAPAAPAAPAVVVPMSPSMSEAMGAAMPFLTDPAAFADCLGRIAAGAQPSSLLLLDLARWEVPGEAAPGMGAVMVLPSAALDRQTPEPWLEHVYLVDADCDLIGHVRVDTDTP